MIGKAPPIELKEIVLKGYFKAFNFTRLGNCALALDYLCSEGKT